MPRAHSNGIEIEYAILGESKARPLFLMRGLGTQMIQWHPSFCEMLADAGHRLVIFDNRAAGLSTHLHDAGPPRRRSPAHGSRSSRGWGTTCPRARGATSSRPSPRIREPLRADARSDPDQSIRTPGSSEYLVGTPFYGSGKW
jgi:pimeloyl-ACP methyl ester carboxylesterase